MSASNLIAYIACSSDTMWRENILEAKLGNWWPFTVCVVTAALAGSLYWLAGKVEFVAAVKPFLNFAGGLTAIFSGAFWVSNAQIALFSGTDNKLINLAGRFNLWAAIAAFTAAVLLIIPYLLDNLSRPPKRDQDTLISSIKIASLLVKMPTDTWEHDLYKQGIHADQTVEVLGLMRDILSASARKHLQ